MTAHHRNSSSEEIAADVGVPWNKAQTSLVAYRSAGIGVFGALARWVGMPLEKIALFMNSSQVPSGKGQFAKAAQLTFQEGWVAPYRVVGPASLTAWFLQYSVMGIAFQLVDRTLSQVMGVRPVYYGKELMEPPVSSPSEHSDNDYESTVGYKVRNVAKTAMAPVIAASMESFVSNRAEAQRYFGPTKFAELERSMQYNAVRKLAGPAFLPNAMRNVLMCQTTFVLTPTTYKLYFPQDLKSNTSLFWYGLGMNVFAGNVAAITQQALWGRSLDYLAANSRIQYSEVVRQGLAKEGLAAFFTPPKWFSRVLMNAPAQGTLPWFYNEVLPLGERPYLSAVKLLLDVPAGSDQLRSLARSPSAVVKSENRTSGGLVRRRSTVSIRRTRTRPATTLREENLRVVETALSSPIVVSEDFGNQQPEFTATSPSESRGRANDDDDLTQ